MDEERTIAQLEQQIKLNQEIISNLKEFFGSYLSNFLKEYRNEKSEHSDILKKDLLRQDEVYAKFYKLMKEEMSEKLKPEKILELKNKIEYQKRIIIIIKEFFSSNSEFMKLYRKKPPDQHSKMEKLLDEQDKIFQKLELLVKN